MDQPFRVEVRDGHAGLVAATHVAAGKVLLELRGVLRPSPSRYSLQLSEDVHLDVGEGLPPEQQRWMYLNHSCDPNAAVDVETRTLVALRDLQPGEEITFDYDTTEWAMAEPFVCGCGSAGCRRWVAGFRALDPHRKEVLLPQAAPHIRRLHAREQPAAGALL